LEWGGRGRGIGGGGAACSEVVRNATSSQKRMSIVGMAVGVQLKGRSMSWDRRRRSCMQRVRNATLSQKCIDKIVIGYCCFCFYFCVLVLYLSLFYFVFTYFFSIVLLNASLVFSFAHLSFFAT